MTLIKVTTQSRCPRAKGTIEHDDRWHPDEDMGLHAHKYTSYPYRELDNAQLCHNELEFYCMRVCVVGFERHGSRQCSFFLFF
jgi:hypothetical protein